jgi:hypothetical protein
MPVNRVLNKPCVYQRQGAASNKCRLTLPLTNPSSRTGHNVCGPGLPLIVKLEVRIIRVEKSVSLTEMLVFSSAKLFAGSASAIASSGPLFTTATLASSRLGIGGAGGGRCCAVPSKGPAAKTRRVRRAISKAMAVSTMTSEGLSSPELQARRKR